MYYTLCTSMLYSILLYIIRIVADPANDMVRYLDTARKSICSIHLRAPQRVLYTGKKVRARLAKTCSRPKTDKATATAVTSTTTNNNNND